MYNLTEDNRYSFGYYALPNMPRHLDVSVTQGYGDISYSLTDVVDSSGRFQFSISGGLTEAHVGVRVSDPYDVSMYADTSFIVLAYLTSITVAGLNAEYMCSEDGTDWYSFVYDTVPHVNRHMNVTFTGVDWMKENESGSGGRIKFRCMDGSQGDKVITISDPYSTCEAFTATVKFRDIFKQDMFYYTEWTDGSSDMGWPGT